MPLIVGGSRNWKSPSGGSIFTTSAPRTPSSAPAKGPTPIVVQSTTRMPFNGPVRSLRSATMAVPHSNAGALGQQAATATLRGRGAAGVSFPEDGYLFGRRKTLVIFLGLVMGMLLASINQSILATAVPKIVVSLGGFNDYAWIFTAYMLTTTITV